MEVWHKYAIVFLVLSLAVIGMSARKPPKMETKFSKTEMADIHREVERRIEAFKAKEKQKCRTELMERVEGKVDSILMFDIKRLLRESGEWVDGTPTRPIPPERPELIRPDEDSPLQPLIEDENAIFNRD